MPNVIKRVTGFADDIIEVDLGNGIYETIRVTDDVADQPKFFETIKGILSGEEIIDVKAGEQFTKAGRRTTLKSKVRYNTAGKASSTSGYNYAYTTDEYGRIVSAEGDLKLSDVAREEIENANAQRIVGREDRITNQATWQENDDGGHLIGAQFKGSGELDNLVPMNAQINRSGGKWFNMETTWKNALDQGRKVTVKIEPVYSGKSLRPVKFEIEYTIDGRKIVDTIMNQIGG